MAYTPLHPQKPLSVEALYTVHYFEYSGSYAFPGETHDFWEFLYVDKGILRVTAGERTWELSTGQMIFHQPGEFHALSALGVAPDLVVVSFACQSPCMDFFRNLITHAGAEERALLARIIEESRAAFSTPLNSPYTTLMERRTEQPFGSEQLICAALEELLIRLIREGRLNFTQIASRLGYQSIHYFSRRFHLITGMTPSEYAHSVKMLAELPGTSVDDRTNNG
ncbi:MAG: AraC family transcriptional regulator [Clostridiales bacterium]|nr:AraC family transcriptional regulator [Clostridiales bacterium]